jgi:hypothetical protein
MGYLMSPEEDEWAVHRSLACSTEDHSGGVQGGVSLSPRPVEGEGGDPGRQRSEGGW